MPVRAESGTGWTFINGTLTITDDSAWNDSNLYDETKTIKNGIRDGIEKVVIENASSVPIKAFNICYNLKRVEIKDANCRTIGSYAFQNCSSLLSIEMSNVETIDDFAFISQQELRLP